MARGDPRKRTALIVTVLNEAATIDRLLESVAAQSQIPDEIVIVDGGSTDATWERVEAWTARLPVRAIRAPGATIAHGRNLAVENAAADIIAVTDAGVWLAPHWLAELRAALAADIDVASGFFRPDPRTTFEQAMGATVLPAIDDIDPATFLPSSRSVLFRRAAWRRVGGYPEWLDYCEDLVFDLALRRSGCRFVFVPAAVAWFRPRSTLVAFWRQYFLYARGDGKANLWLRRHLVRYGTYALGALLGLAVLRGRRARWRVTAAVLLAVAMAAYTRRPYARLQPYLSRARRTQKLYAWALVPLIRLVGDVAKMLGYPVGVLWRARMRWICRSSS